MRTLTPYQRLFYASPRMTPPDHNIERFSPTTVRSKHGESGGATPKPHDTGGIPRKNLIYFRIVSISLFAGDHG